jgi:phosphate starvation-inducible PhoH-like protein
VTKRARKTKDRFNKQNRDNKQYNNDNVVDYNKFRKTKSKVVILPRNIAQEDYVELLDDDTRDIIFATGPAGTGKTLLGVLAAIRSLKAGEIDKVVITRPAVSVDEQHGFLPGDLNEKMAPWTRPIFDVFEEYYSTKEISSMLEENVIEVAPLAYMRGRTFKNSCIIADEMQNATPSQMKMLLTRIGEGSRIILTGDLAQHDRGFENNGLKDFMKRLNHRGSRRIGFVEFEQQDVERHPAVKEVLFIYGDED